MTFRSENEDRTTRAARITAEAIRVFGDADRAKLWMSRKNALLGNASPLELVESAVGAERVSDELIRIEYGELSA